MKSLWIALLLPALALNALQAAEDQLADALADATAQMAAQGKSEKAKELGFKALAHSETCPVALYELGKIFETEGNAIAAVDFLTRSAFQLENGEKAHKEYSNKLADAKARLQRLNPCAVQFTLFLEDYARDLGAIAKKSRDAFTAEEALQRVEALKLPTLIAAAKLPEIKIPDDKNLDAKNAVLSLDVKHELADAGWSVISGKWKKVGNGVYEVTDGKLEVKKTSGCMQLALQAGGTGSLSVMVHDPSQDTPRGMGAGGMRSRIQMQWPRMDMACGVSVVGTLCTIKTAENGGSASGMSRTIRSNLVRWESQPRHTIKVSDQEGEAQIVVDGKTEWSGKFAMTGGGLFTISIQGTLTVENPKFSNK